MARSRENEQTPAERRLAELQADNERLAAELSSERERFRVVFEHAPAGVAVVSIAQLRYLYANPEWLRFLGRTPEEMFSVDPYRFLMEATHADDFPQERLEFQRLVDGEIDAYRLTKRFIRKSGEVRWALVTINAVRKPDRRVEYVVCHLVDIHEQKLQEQATRELEDRLRHVQKLEALGTLTGGIAHDFNNNLLVIMGYAQLLANATASDETLAQYARSVVESAQRSADLTRQLLAFGRRQVLEPRTIELDAVVDRMQRILERLLGEKVRLVSTLAAKNPVFCDAGQIEQVIMNLAMNARDSMPDGGRLSIETYDAPQGEVGDLDLRGGDYVALRVSDSGCGIPPATLPRVFEPFFTTKEPGKGTGLGLSTVQGIVRQSHGAVTVESQVGRGSAFTVYLPRAEQLAEAPVQHVKAKDAPPERRGTVLVCDDDDRVRRVIVDVLHLAGYRTLEASDGQSALNVIAGLTEPIDLLITDAVMPKMDGSELIVRLRATNPELPVLVVTGHIEPEQWSRIEGIAGVRRLGKPFLPADLLRATRELSSLPRAPAPDGAPDSAPIVPANTTRPS